MILTELVTINQRSSRFLFPHPTLTRLRVPLLSSHATRTAQAITLILFISTFFSPSFSIFITAALLFILRLYYDEIKGDTYVNVNIIVHFQITT
ncbi:hypothetical protein BDR06DRAFT_602497 [Suillus hirtellus]|nr:hypothetical protein BDR06DRAFT_602497 [Suillus hirtellus]